MRHVSFPGDSSRLGILRPGSDPRRHLLTSSDPSLQDGAPSFALATPGAWGAFISRAPLLALFQVPRSKFHVGALIAIRASACPPAGRVSSGTGPQAARNCPNQGNYRGRNDSDCVAAAGRKEKEPKPETWNVKRGTWNR